MKIPSMILGGLLCAGLLFSGACPSALAGSGRTADSASASVSGETTAPVVAQAGTDAEAQAYEQRETRSPEVQDFEGGAVVIVAGGFILLILVIVLIVVLLGN